MTSTDYRTNIKSSGKRKMITACLGSAILSNAARALTPPLPKATVADKVSMARNKHIFVGIAEKLVFVHSRDIVEKSFEIYDAWSPGLDTMTFVRVLDPIYPPKWTDDREIYFTGWGSHHIPNPDWLGRPLIWITVKYVWKTAYGKNWAVFDVVNTRTGSGRDPEPLSNRAAIEEAITQELKLNPAADPAKR